jgi:hypothetical protein
MRRMDPSDQPFALREMAPRRRRVGVIIGIAGGAVALVVAAVAVTALAMRDDAGAPTPAAAGQTTTTAAVAPTTGAPAASTAAAATTAAQAPGVLKLGAKAEGPNGTSVAHAYKQPVATKAPKPEQEGFEWGAADVEVCSKIAGYLNNLSWTLVYADHTRIEASSVGYQQFPLPEYPTGDTDITAGQCIRGWITYPVPAGKRPVSVHYQPQSFQADWQVT